MQVSLTGTYKKKAVHCCKKQRQIGVWVSAFTTPNTKTKQLFPKCKTRLIEI
jgi:hypothetical protein